MTLPAPPASTSPAIGSLEHFHPAYFALVMATGIVSIASHFLGYERVAQALFAINLLAYAALWLVYIARLLRYPRAMAADLADHARGVGYLTIVAGTCLVGSQLHIFLGWQGVAVALWFFAIAVWVLVIYAWLTLATMRPKKPALAKGINGGWLLLTVSTQALAILGTFVADRFAEPEHVIFACLAFYMLGAMLYIWVISLVFYRWLFFDMEGAALTPTYWINTGAVAITTLAGARLIETTSGHVAPMAHFLSAFNLFFWATATWWAPLLFIVGAWRMLVDREPVRYEPGYWSMVFPLGMYTACTWAYAEAAGVRFLKPIPEGFIFIAWTAWVLTMIGTLRALWRWWSSRKALH